MVALSPANAGVAAAAPTRRKRTPSRLVMLSPGAVRAGFAERATAALRTVHAPSPGFVSQVCFVQGIQFAERTGLEQLYDRAENGQAKVPRCTY